MACRLRLCRCIALGNLAGSAFPGMVSGNEIAHGIPDCRLTSVTPMKYLFLIFENIRRNLIRTILTALGTMVLVLVVTLVFTILSTLDRITTEKAQNIKGIVTEKWQVPSQMPWAYASGLTEGAAHEEGDVVPQDYMTWGFYFGSIEPDRKKMSFENLVFAFVMEPEKIPTMMDDLDNLQGSEKQMVDEAVSRFKETRQGIIIGPGRLEKLKKRIGDRIIVYGRNFKDIDLEVEIVGTFPKGRYDQHSILRRDYFNAAMDAYPLSHAGKTHPLADKSLNLVWLKVPTRDQFNSVGDQITKSASFTQPAVKFETSSSGIATFLQAYRDIIWGMRWLLAPACIATLSLVISNAISISVRERQTEFAVMKVLGFRPSQILWLVLTEALLIGTFSGLLSAALTYWLVNVVIGGIPFQIGFIPKFLVPEACFWWGGAIGAGTAFAGSVVPAWSARSVRVANVFAKVA